MFFFNREKEKKKIERIKQQKKEKKNRNYNRALGKSGTQ